VIAERAPLMRIAMAVLAVGSVGIGLVQIPKVDFLIDDFLKPSFADSSLYATRTHDGLLVLGLVLGTVLGLTGIAIAYRVWVQRPGLAAAIRQRAPALYELFLNKWYFDELLDRLVVRPTAAAGRFARDSVERRVIDEGIDGGTTGLVRAGSAAVRAAQNGFVRYYAALLVLGVAGVGFYFLLQS
jgi:NADH-quinone oxidoreductase subunit L